MQLVSSGESPRLGKASPNRHTEPFVIASGPLRMNCGCAAATKQSRTVVRDALDCFAQLILGAWKAGEGLAVTKKS
jgi:hypothetical protein